MIPLPCVFARSGSSVFRLRCRFAFSIWYTCFHLQFQTHQLLSVLLVPSIPCSLPRYACQSTLQAWIVVLYLHVDCQSLNVQSPKSDTLQHAYPPDLPTSDHKFRHDRSYHAIEYHADKVGITLSRRCRIHYPVHPIREQDCPQPCFEKISNSFSNLKYELSDSRGMNPSKRSSSSWRIVTTSSGVGSGGVGAGYPSSGKRIRSNRSMRPIDVLGMSRRVSMICGMILSNQS